MPQNKQIQTYLANAISQLNYNELAAWHLPKLAYFSEKKKLFDYQKQALRNLTKLLYRYYKKDGELTGKEILYDDCIQKGMDESIFCITKKLDPARFKFFKDYYPVYNNQILASNFFNRACFWMATGSGKSLVLIKTIELLNHLQEQKLIDKRAIMLLLPRQDLIEQFCKEVMEFNLSREKKIELVNLKDYDKDQRQGELFSGIKVYYYRSDLLRAERKETILDFKSYENEGKWYLFLDEAHRGEKQNSKMQNYVSVLSRNGFAFNFSATFSEAIDFATTCFNFNLSKFISAGYGKNIYLSRFHFDFNKSKDEIDERSKQKQLLKSLLTFVWVSKSKTQDKKYTYHMPLLMTLVHTVNTEDSDLLLFFQKLVEIASGELDLKLFEQVKEELADEHYKNRKFVFGEEELDLTSKVSSIQIEDLRKYIFHSKQKGRIEIIEGQVGKELALKLETTDRPFALIKIGDAKKFQKDNLAGYFTNPNYDNKNFFKNINQSQDILLLIGSRSFYEGWDSNRPNVLNLINIGKGNAKKFVLQAIGRGIRIEPKANDRVRAGKNKLLETLFVYATDQSSVKAIIETVAEHKIIDSFDLALSKNSQIIFDLLIPCYKKVSTKTDAVFYISDESKNNFLAYFSCFTKNTFLLKTGLSSKYYDCLQTRINNKNDFFRTNSENNYYNFSALLQKIITHLSVNHRVVEKITKLEEQIIHFKHIKVFDLSKEEQKSLQAKIKKTKGNTTKMDNKDIAKLLLDNKITKEEILTKLNSSDSEVFEKNNSKIFMQYFANHYYLPLIYAKRANYIRHVIKTESEVKFIEVLQQHIANNETLSKKWMFSKVDESLDQFYIPYYCKKSNSYRKFYSDFIFWINKDKHYKIVFVDPKGTSHTDYEHKVDGFIKLFEVNGKPKIFDYNGCFQVSFDLRLVTDNKNKVSEGYQKYWFDGEGLSFLQ